MNNKRNFAECKASSSEGPQADNKRHDSLISASERGPQSSPPRSSSSFLARSSSSKAASSSSAAPPACAAEHKEGVDHHLELTLCLEFLPISSLASVASVCHSLYHETVSSVNAILPLTLCRLLTPPSAICACCRTLFHDSFDREGEEGKATGLPSPQASGLPASPRPPASCPCCDLVLFGGSATPEMRLAYLHRPVPPDEEAVRYLSGPSLAPFREAERCADIPTRRALLCEHLALHGLAAVDENSPLYKAYISGDFDYLSAGYVAALMKIENFFVDPSCGVFYAYDDRSVEVYEKFNELLKGTLLKRLYAHRFAISRKKKVPWVELVSFTCSFWSTEIEDYVQALECDDDGLDDPYDSEDWEINGGKDVLYEDDYDSDYEEDGVGVPWGSLTLNEVADDEDAKGAYAFANWQEEEAAKGMVAAAAAAAPSGAKQGGDDDLPEEF